MNVVIGCPVKDRAWILPAWFAAIDRACKEAEIDPTFAFVVGTYANGCATEEYLLDALEDRDHVMVRVLEAPSMGRRWNPERYEEMSNLRNQLLGMVRRLEPDYFLSLDSDILLHPQAIASLLDAMSDSSYAAVGGKLYMTPKLSDRYTTSGATINAQGVLQRVDGDAVFHVDVIMALKLMRPEAYNVDYVSNHNGEDIGFCLECKERNLRLGWDGRVTSKHVMNPKMLREVDPRVGF